MRKQIHFILLFVSFLSFGQSDRLIIRMQRSLVGKNLQYTVAATEQNATPTAASLIRNNLTACASPSILVDGSNSTGYTPGYAGQNFYPLKTEVDLGGNYNLTRTQYYDNGGGAVLTVSSGTTLYNMTADTVVTLSGGGLKTIYPGNKSANFVEFSLASGTGPSEIHVFGVPVSIPSVPALSLHARNTFINSIGFDGNSYDLASLLWSGSTMREYEYLEKCWNAQSELLVSPTNQGGTFHDAEYAARKTAGINTLITTYHCPKWYQSGYTSASQNWNTDTRPCPYSADPYLPASYTDLASLAFQYPFRWGNTSGTLSNSSVNTVATYGNGANIKRTGLNVVKYYEFGNELDRWYTGTAWRNQSMEPSMYAAFQSALYDGDEGRMGALYGLKQADTSSRLVMTALSDMNTDYIKMMYYWAKAKRTDGKLPFDVLNYHYYSTDGPFPQQATTSISPEADGFAAKINAATDFALRYAPEKQIWLSEFGFDTNSDSPYGVAGSGGTSSISGMNTWQVQAAWLMRSLFEGIATGRIDKFLIYEFHNELIGSGGVNETPNFTNSAFLSSSQFSTSGLVLNDNAYLPVTLPSTNVGTVANGTSITFTYAGSLWDPNFFQVGNLGRAYDNTFSNFVDFTITSKTSTTVTGSVYSHTGSGTFTSLTIGTKFAKKLSWYVMDNTIAVLGPMTFVADLSTGSYRVHKYSNGVNKEAFVVWSPTSAGTVLSSQTINIGRNNCTYRDLENTSGTEVSQTVTGTSITTNITEMPKIFYSTY